MNRFATARLDVTEWAVGVPYGAEVFDDLQAMLTPAVLADLPPSLQVPDGENGITQWVTARLAESDMFILRARENGQLVGVLLLVEDEQGDIHLGYFLAEQAWGKGFATELMIGLIKHLRKGTARRVMGGVAVGNAASARVLQKAGFNLLDGEAPVGTDFFVLELT